MLSAEGAKPESNNRRKSDLGHVGRRFVGDWVSGYAWYLELSREIIPNTIHTHIPTTRISVDCLTPASRLRRSASV